MKPYPSRLFQTVLYSQDPRFQLVRHLAVGGSGVVFNWIAFSSLRQFSSLSTLQCTLIVHVVMLAVVFPLQKMFTFKNVQNPRQQMLRFLAIDAVYISLDFCLATLFVDWLGLAPFIGKACGLALLTPLSFLVQKLWVFRS